jgi:hypothetical protein
MCVQCPPSNQPATAVRRQGAFDGARVRFNPSVFPPNAAARAAPAFVRVFPGELMGARAGETAAPYCVSSSIPISINPFCLDVSVLLSISWLIACIAGSRSRPTLCYLIFQGFGAIGGEILWAGVVLDGK